MVTREQALQLRHRDELHAGECKVTIGPRGGTTDRREVWRVNGQTKTWKTDATRFQVPLKYGFNGPYTYLDETNANLFHLAAECHPTVIDQSR